MAAGSGAQHALDNLERYIYLTRARRPAAFGTATAAVRYQPKGVIGNIVPWTSV
ncbi:hypothetical protein AB5I41_08625 [Sphingomonas sp. MMS24-JH45]